MAFFITSRPAEHRVERQGETLTIARAAGTPTRLVRSNALFCVAQFWEATRRPIGALCSSSRMPSRRCRSLVGATAELPAMPPELHDPDGMAAKRVTGLGFAHVGFRADSRLPRQAASVRKPIGRPATYVEHSQSPARRASTTGREATAPPRLVWCIALLGRTLIWAITS